MSDEALAVLATKRENWAEISGVTDVKVNLAEGTVSILIAETTTVAPWGNTDRLRIMELLIARLRPFVTYWTGGEDNRPGPGNVLRQVDAVLGTASHRLNPEDLIEPDAPS